MSVGVKSSKKRPLKIVFGIIAIVLVVALCGAAFIFRDELMIVSSIRQIDKDKKIYYMEVTNDYHFEEFLKSGGASSDKEVSAFLTKCISEGFYSVDITDQGPSCSVISAKTPDGSHIWGRNFDWAGSVPIIVRCTPKDGYTSIATCDFKNITASSETLPTGIANKMLAIAALYVPMDGMNEAGLCVADLEVNEGGMIDVNTGKTDLTITTAIRLLLNDAATVDEAVKLLEQYDIHASGGISHHLAVSDATGASVSIEFVNGKMVVVSSDCITNFNIANEDTAAGGESAQKRFDILRKINSDANGILTQEQVKDALWQVVQSEGESTTQWTIVYDQASLTANYYFNFKFDDVYIYSIGE